MLLSRKRPIESLTFRRLFRTRSSSTSSPKIMRNICRFIIVASLIISGCESLFSQTPASSQVRTPDSSALRQSRADREADRLVSLSPDRIIEILNKEPGLLLEVKKALVRKAYEQGRILEPSDLTDEALYDLIREDENIRVLATREIEARSYIRAKPTREELATQTASRQQPNRDRLDQLNSGVSQEDQYWSQRNLPRQSPAIENPENSPTTPAPARPESNPARQVLQASGRDQSEDSELFEGLPYDTSKLSSIRPDELPALLSASSSSNSSSSFFNQGADSGQSSSGKLPSLPAEVSNPAIAAELNAASQDPNGSNSDADTQSTPARPRPVVSRSSSNDSPRFRRRPNPYANVPSLYDLYSQVSDRTAPLQRFGENIFTNGTGNLDRLPMDLPAGPDYVIGPGDGLSVELWGSVSQRLKRTVDREGRISLPEAGMISVAGKTLGDTQRIVQNVLRTEFRDVQADVSLARLRTVRVYVVGDVQNPGAYDISSLSTALNALYAAGGPTSRGSLRNLQQFRGSQLVQKIDVYDLLLHGVRSDLERIQSGDTIRVPPLGPQVKIDGMVRRPAVYELNGEKNLAEVLELAGGVLSSGTLRHIDVERIVAHQSRTMLRLDVPEANNQQSVDQALEQFTIEDGDQVHISPILPYSDKTVYLDGHVFRPGKYAFRDGMKISDVVHSYSDLLPEPSTTHAEIIRLEGPDLKPTVLTFNLKDALEGKDQDIGLKPFDTIRIFGRYDFEEAPLITVTGEVRDPGDHLTNGVTHLRDAVFLAGGVAPDAELNDAQVFRKSTDGKLRVISVNLRKALAGDEHENIQLDPSDRVFIHRSQSRVDPARVSIEGEVERPGKYPLGENMSASDLVKLAGGFKRSADTRVADLTTYMEQEGGKVAAEHHYIEIAKAMDGAPDTDFRLRDGDVLSIHQIPGWNDIGASVTLQGEVAHPGTYGIHEGERLSAVLERAGGLRPSAYMYGSILERTQVRQLEAGTRAQLISNVQSEGASLRNVSDPGGAAAVAQWQTTLKQLQNTPPAGRLVIHVSNDVKRWKDTPADIELRAGDVLVVPKQPNFVMISGAVYNPTAITFRSGKSAGWYLNQAGGPTPVANKKGIFVIRANGSVIGNSGGIFSGSVLSSELRPGDMIVVPEKALGGTARWRNILQASQLVSSVGIAIQVARGF